MQKLTVRFSEEERKRFEELLEHEGLDVSATAIRRQSQKTLPMSYGQRRLWFLQQYEREKHLYNVPVVVRLKGKLDVGALRESVEEIIERHEVLRTSYGEEKGEAVQVIEERKELEWKVEELEGKGEEERAVQLRGRVEEEARRAFDLGRSPLIRGKVVKVGEEEHVLVLTMHHIASDGWSVGILLRELGVLYGGKTGGEKRELEKRELEKRELEKLELQYGDYAVWQRERLERGELEGQMEYWRKQLGGLKGGMELGIGGGRAGAEIEGGEGGEVRFVVGKELKKKIEEMGRGEGVTLYMSLLGGFQILLQRYSGGEEVVVGTAVAGRSRREWEGVMGFFVNTVVVRTKLGGGESVGEALKQVREAALGGYENQEVPFEKVVEEVQPEREAGRSPLFEVMFLLEREGGEREKREWGGLKVEREEVDLGVQKFNLTLGLREKGEVLEGAIGYRKGVMEEESARRMAQHYERVLEAMARDREQKIGELELLSQEERQQVLVEWNRTEREYGEAERRACLPELFEQQAIKRGKAVAVEYEGEDLSYQELNRRANQLARYLRKQGVGPEVRVGLCMERSLEMVISMLAILKAGGCYVPLDPNYPQERLEFMLQDSQAVVLITQKAMRQQLPGFEGELLEWESCQQLIGQEDGSDLDAAPDPANAAYVIYTSGSTGNPKGAVVTHQNVVRLMDRTHRWFGFDSNDVVTLFHSYAFDFSVWELWSALHYGGRLVIVPYWVSRSPQDFLELLIQRGVTVLSQTPSAFQELMAAEESREKQQTRKEFGQDTSLKLRVVVFGGEALEYERLRSWLRRHPEGPQLVNMYGITETTVHVTYHPITLADLQERSSRSVVGVRIEDLKTYVLDQWMQALPVGVKGELYVGGAGVARGYLGRPELTAERFVPNPYATEEGERLYRSGDQVSWRADGTLDYFGRLDQQIKLRGFRIELGEIESALREQAEIKQAAVMMREVQSEKKLVAYVVMEPAADMEEIREALRKRLPEYMVPAAWVKMEQLPLTVNGKLDRAALPNPQQNSRPTDYAAPRNEQEERLAEIWGEVLGLEKVGIEESFFNLGGHSLLAMKAVARASAVFQVEIPIRKIFEYPTISALATVISELKSRSRTKRIDSIPRFDRQQKLPLSLNQEGRLLLEWWAAVRSRPAPPFNIIDGTMLRGDLDLDVLEDALNEIIRRHESWRTTFSDPRRIPLDRVPPEVLTHLARWKAGEAITQKDVSELLHGLLSGSSLFSQQVHRYIKVRLRLIDLSGLDAEEKTHEIRQILAEEIARQFDYERPPLVRPWLVKINSREHLLIMMMPHLLGDAWSVQVFRNELKSLYERISSGSHPFLPELPIQYADYATWQKKRLQEGSLEEMRSYWERKWSEYSLLNIQDLAFTLPVPSVSTPAFGMEQVTLSRPFVEQLRLFLREQNLTLHMLGLVALALVLHHYTGKTKIGCWGVFANRTQPETENLLGWFATAHILGVDLGAAAGMAELLDQVRNSVLEAHQYQEIPLVLLWGSIIRGTTQNPGNTPSQVDPNVAFLLVNQTEPCQVANGLSFEPSALPFQTAQRALTFVLGERKYEISIMAQYSLDRFAAQDIRDVLNDMNRVLQQILRTPSMLLSHLVFNCPEHACPEAALKNSSSSHPMAV